MVPSCAEKTAADRLERLAPPAWHDPGVARSDRGGPEAARSPLSATERSVITKTAAIGASKVRFLFVALAVGAFAIGLDTFVVIGGLEQIIREFGTSPRAAAWIVSLYAFCYAVFAPLNARIFRGYNSRDALVISVGVFTLGNVVCATSPSFGGILAGRVI